MDTVSISALSRDDFGKGASRKLRAQARVPAIVYREGKAPAHLSFDARELTLLYRKSENPNMVLSIDVDGSPITAILKEADKHPVSRQLLHVDFYQVVEGVEVSVEVPVRTVGRSAGATLGGQLRMLRRTIRVTCKPEFIPADIVIDISPLNIDDFVRASDLPEIANVKLLRDNDYNILSIDGKRAQAAAAAEAAEAEEAEAEA